MKVLIINGSPRLNGNSSKLTDELIGIFNKEGVEVDLYQIGAKAIRGCMACGYCHEHGECVFKDDANDLSKRFENADGLIVISPVYYGSANGSVISLLDRLFYSSHFDKRFKVGAAFAIARRAGTTATFDELNKYFTIMQMPVVSSQYWNMVYGLNPGEVAKDEEGMQTMRTLGQNMAWMIKRLNISEEGHPTAESPEWTNFVR